jgi:DNA-binding NarL/FixJ family response regulator
MTVLLADDHAMVREGLMNNLAGYKKIQGIGDTADGQEAIDLTHLYHPNVIVMDVNMPSLNEVKTAQDITKEFPSIKIIVLSINEDDETVSAMRQAGAVAY